MEEPKKRGSEEKQFILDTMTAFCKANGFTLETEHRFCESRLWRIDYYIPEIRLGVEYEGIFAGKSRHTTLGGYMEDCNKYNTAALHGVSNLRLTAGTYERIGEMLDLFISKNKSDFSLRLNSFAVSLKKKRKSKSKKKTKQKT